jgi:hypothetical protein
VTSKAGNTINVLRAERTSNPRLIPEQYSLCRRMERSDRSRGVSCSDCATEDLLDLRVDASDWSIEGTTG